MAGQPDSAIACPALSALSFADPSDSRGKHHVKSYQKGSTLGALES